ncbi:hypothetical protein mRhiFer1_008193 [Rhinolophus ferrumequinum]|uniref:Uncharacterized protein n=1 Tax=Rhinolophus ferrumequinum TaxID=59479 RepID=A0A7J7W7N5_RHIFE|nr:hypothetical protein mRhiFer1_008193 [Rhinolophus ferrumequinum]
MSVKSERDDGGSLCVPLTTLTFIQQMRRSWRRERAITPERNRGTRIPALICSVAIGQTAYSQSIALKDTIQVLALSTQIMLALLLNNIPVLTNHMFLTAVCALHFTCVRRYTVLRKDIFKKTQLHPFVGSPRYVQVSI